MLTIKEAINQRSCFTYSLFNIHLRQYSQFKGCLYAGEASSTLLRCPEACYYLVADSLTSENVAAIDFVLIEGDTLRESTVYCSAAVKLSSTVLCLCVWVCVSVSVCTSLCLIDMKLESQIKRGS